MSVLKDADLDGVDDRRLIETSHELGRVKEAIEQLKGILAIRKTTQADPFLSTAAHYIFAKAYRVGGRAKEAIKPLERVLALSRNGTPQQDFSSEIIHNA
ncbi:hypothetical protein E4U36_001244 [Claviceps purpurea]|nr:hypothetical protein E4U36_001244 [Claviceps purpurea]